MNDAVHKEEVKKMQAVLDRQKTAFLSAGPPPLMRRQDKLDKLARLLKQNRSDLIHAISTDFGHRSSHETLMTDVHPVLSHIAYLRKHLSAWMRPERRHISALFAPASGKVVYQPLGSVGIISPWNYPLQLSLVPLATALAAGNRVMLKLSEITPTTSQVLAEILTQAFAEDEIYVVTGGADVAAAFSQLPFDHLVFTGSTAVGRQIMAAAAQNLTPITLELGGKSPAIVAPDADLRSAVEAIMWGKTLNAGQTCVAPDYVLVPKDRLEPFIDQARQAISAFYPTLKANPDYTAIVNDAHYARLVAWLREARDAGTREVEINPAHEVLSSEMRKLAPSLLIDPDPNLHVMKEEIFGPMLPVVTYESLEDAISYVNARQRPLALYLFAKNRRSIDQVTRKTVSGGMCINETVLHVAQDDLPFGGVGSSGMGAYHGHEGFKTLSHAKSVFQQSRMNTIGFMRPPYGRLVDGILRVLVGKKSQVKD